MLPEVGNAIADYLQHGRPEVNLPFVFLSAGRPITKTTTASFSHGVAELIRRSNIAVPKGKKTVVMYCGIVVQQCSLKLVQKCLLFLRCSHIPAPRLPGYILK